MIMQVMMQETARVQRPTTRPEQVHSRLATALCGTALPPDGPAGGDFADTFRLDDAHAALVLGDVCGMGPEAAQPVPKIKAALRAFLRADPAPERALMHLNDWLLSDRLCGPSWHTVDPLPVCAAVIVLNCQTGAGRCARAGAEPPLRRRADGGWTALGYGGLPLGTLPQHDYAADSFDLAAGDILLMATDGLTEARRRTELGTRFLDAVGVMEIAERALASEISLARVGTAIFESARRFGGGFRDDASLLLARRRL